MISLGAFYAVFNRQKTWTVTRSLGTRILRFNREMKLTKTVQKLIIQKFTLRPKGVAPSPPPHKKYATDRDGMDVAQQRLPRLADFNAILF